MNLSRLVFNKHDTDKSGYIDRVEFKELCYGCGHILSDRELDAAMKLIDRSGNNKIEYSEFQQWWTTNSRWGRVELTTDQLEALNRSTKYFQFFDKDHSGSLDRNEFSKLHADLNKHYPGKLPALDAAMRKLDNNNDGVISLGEYIDWLQAEGVLKLRN